MKILKKQLVKIHIFLFFFILASTLFSCEKDNFAPPSLTLSVKLVYKGEPLQVEYNQVPFQIYQYGFGKIGPISQVFAPEGTYSSLLFAGDYKLTVSNATVPFRWPQSVAGKPDSLTINLTSNKTMDIEVIPYFMLRDSKIASAAGSVTSNFKVEKVINDVNGKSISKVVLFINKTLFVSITDNIASTTLNGSDITDVNNINLAVKVPTLVPTQNYVFARVGVQIAGLNSWVFSPVQKLNL